MLRTLCQISLIVTLILIFANCAKYKEEAPFINGLYFKYKDKSGKIETLFEVYDLGNNKFKIIKTEKTKVFKDKVQEIFVDSYGRVYKSSFKDYEGKFSPIWIPANQMQVGDTYDNGFTILKKDKWREWIVIIVKNPDINEVRYYDLNTGYFLGVEGKMGMSYEVSLIDTNAEIPLIK